MVDDTSLSHWVSSGCISFLNKEFTNISKNEGSALDDSNSLVNNASILIYDILIRCLESSTVGFHSPLPVQIVSIPLLCRALKSLLPMDICLHAPTGSGKTLCFILPMLEMIVNFRHERPNDTKLRGIILVPNTILSEQIYYVVQSILLASRNLPDTSVSDDTKSYLNALRQVSVGVFTGSDGLDKHEGKIMTISVDTNNQTLFQELNAEFGGYYQSNDSVFTFLKSNSYLLDNCLFDQINLTSKYDLLILTPQQALRLFGLHAPISSEIAKSFDIRKFIDNTETMYSLPNENFFSPRFTSNRDLLVDVRFLVMDEADQMMSGGGFLRRFVDGCEETQRKYAQRQSKKRERCGIFLQPSLVNSFRTGISEITSSSSRIIMRKILCSASLTPHVARISEARLCNCCFLSFNSDGHALPESMNFHDKTKCSFPYPNISPILVDKEGVATKHKTVRYKYTLPNTLQEHIFFVSTRNRHTILLKLLRAIVLQGIISKNDSNNHSFSSLERVLDDNLTKESEPSKIIDDFISNSINSTSPIASNCSSPALSHMRVENSFFTPSGRGILIFCPTPEIARVLGHFLSGDGFHVLELTTISSDQERRKALLRGSSSLILSPDLGMKTDENKEKRPKNDLERQAQEIMEGVRRKIQETISDKSMGWRVILTTDMLARGIDIPDVGHVILYDAPVNTAQYIHRVGRTARGRCLGHAYLLLTKEGPSGTEADGELSQWRKFGESMLYRNPKRPLRYETNFYVFPSAEDDSVLDNAKRQDALSLAYMGELQRWADKLLERAQSVLEKDWFSVLDSHGTVREIA